MSDKINFPANPSQGQEYIFNNFKYIFKGNRWQSARNDSSSDLDYFKNDLAADNSSIMISGVPAHELVSKVDGVPVASVMWFPSREMTANGYIPADGQLLSRTVYDSLWKMVESGKVPVVTDTAWNNDPSLKGSYSLGDGSTTFRVPGYNSKGLFLRGDGVNTSEVGHIQGDAIRNITASFGLHAGERPSIISAWGGAMSPSIYHAVGYRSPSDLAEYASASSSGGINFDSSKVVPTADENRPVNVAGVWMIKAFSAAVNEGVIDAAQLGTALAALSSEMNTLKDKIVEMESDAYRQPEMESLWVGNAGTTNVIVNLSRELVAGDILKLRHGKDNYGTSAMMISEDQVDGTTSVQFQFGSGAVTSTQIINKNQLKFLAFTSGYAVTEIMALKWKK